MIGGGCPRRAVNDEHKSATAGRGRARARARAGPGQRPTEAREGARATYMGERGTGAAAAGRQAAGFVSDGGPDEPGQSSGLF